jgi:hypothetical protein
MERPIDRDGHTDERVESMLNRVSSEIREGLRHGHFRFAIICETKDGGKRIVVFEAGKSYRFLIPKEEL